MAAKINKISDTQKRSDHLNFIFPPRDYLLSPKKQLMKEPYAQHLNINLS
jgi:hypothetical protein